MKLELDPLLLFPAASVLSAALAVLQWRARRRVALLAAGLAVMAVLCVGNEMAERAARNAIRVDLLLTIPAISAAAIVTGIIALRRPPPGARIVAAALAAAGGITFGWFTWAMTRSARDAGRLTAIDARGRKLYWEETVRCQGNLEKRFGSIRRRDHPCYGNLVVTSRSSGAYPYTRAIVNDGGDAYLMFTSDAGIEDSATLGDGPAARLTPAEDGRLWGESNAGGSRLKVELRALRTEACEARIDSAGRTSVLTLKRVQLAACDMPGNPPVRFAGAWGAVEPVEASPQYRRLNQLWLWETSETARGLYLSRTAPRGMRIEFNFVERLRGRRRAPDQWDLQVINDGDGKTAPTLTVTLTDGRARVTGPSALLGTPRGEVLLERQEAVSHPKIALTPVGDPDRFAAYFDNVLFNLNIPWTAP